jgi:uncharacterized paraquat-inducible protein A
MNIEDYQKHVIRYGNPKYEIGEKYCSNCRVVFSPELDRIKCPICKAVSLRHNKRETSKRRNRKYIDPAALGIEDI